MKKTTIARNDAKKDLKKDSNNRYKSDSDNDLESEPEIIFTNEDDSFIEHLNYLKINI